MTEFKGRLFGGRLFAGRLFRSNAEPVLRPDVYPIGGTTVVPKRKVVKRRDRDDDVLIWLLAK